MSKVLLYVGMVPLKPSFPCRVQNIFDAAYKLTDSRQQISSYIFDVVRSTVPKVSKQARKTARYAG